MTHFLENELLRLQIDTTTGAITGLLNKTTGHDWIKQNALNGGIRLLIPIPEHRDNRAYSDQQTLSDCKKTDNSLVLRWNEINGHFSGPLPIAVCMTITLNNDQCRFDITIDNQSKFLVEEVWGPILGGWQAPKDEVIQACMVHFNGFLQTAPLTGAMPFNSGYWGTDQPTLQHTFPRPEMHMPFQLLAGKGQGIYWGVHQHQPELVTFQHEGHPGYVDSLHKTLTSETTLDGKAAGIVSALIRLPFIPANTKQELEPVILQAYEGDWHCGADIHAKWRSGWYEQSKQPAWNRDIQCWLTLHINSPEGCVRYRYSQLPTIAAEAKKDGVQLLQLIGWAIGGQDGYEPYQMHDPRLGSLKELKNAIAAIEAMDVRVLLMCKFKWADASTAKFREELGDLVQRDAYGNATFFSSYAYRNLSSQLVGGYRRAGHPLCHNSPTYRRIARREFARILDLEPSGILYDELANPYIYCFDESHGHRPGASNAVGSIALAEDFLADSKKRGDEFLFAGEGPFEGLDHIYATCYLRSWDPLYQPAYKYIQPDMRMATCLTGFDDREMVNQCLCFGYIINFEPFNFKGRTSDIPRTVTYAKKVIALRKRLRAYLWDGRFCNRAGVNVTTSAEDASYTYARFVGTDGKQAVVVSNQNAQKSLDISIFLVEGSRAFQCYSPDQEDSWKSDGKVQIPPRSALVLVEQLVEDESL